MPRPEEFNAAARIDPDASALARTFIPAPVPHELSIVEINDKYNKQLDESLHGNVAKTSVRRDDGGEGAAMTERTRRYYNMAPASVEASLTSGKAWQSLSQAIPLPRMKEWAFEAQEKEWSKHRSAAQRVEVSKDDVMLSPKTGLPMTRTELAAAGDEECLSAIPLEDLVMSADGLPVMNASGTHYLNSYNIEITEFTLNKAITIEGMAEKIEKIERGELSYDALTPEEITSYLSDKTREERDQYYQSAGLSEDAITEAEAAVEDYKYSDISTVLGQLNDPRTAISYQMTINGGSIVPGEIANPTMDFTNVATDMTPVSAAFVQPFTIAPSSISLQNNAESPPLRNDPAPGF